MKTVKKQSELPENKFETWKKKALYGTTTLFETRDDDKKQGEKKEKGNIQLHRPFVDKIIISYENKVKSFFDVWVLILVGYSCFTTMYYTAFSYPSN